MRRVRDTPIPAEVFVLGQHQDDVADEMTPMVGVLTVRELPPSPVPEAESAPRQVTIIPPPPGLPSDGRPRSGGFLILMWGRLKRLLGRRR